jgi:hypothetical protein
MKAAREVVPLHPREQRHWITTDRSHAGKPRHAEYGNPFRRGRGWQKGQVIFPARRREAQGDRRREPFARLGGWGTGRG